MSTKLRSSKEWKTKEKIKEMFKTAIVGDPILSNDMKDGDIILQYNGWVGEIVDNARGSRRIANIHGFFTEAGSIYVWDIAKVVKDGILRNLQLTLRQEKERDKIQKKMGEMF